MAEVTAVNLTSPNTMKWATAGTDRFVRQTHLAGVTQNVDLHDHDAGKGLGVKRLQTGVAPTAAGHVRVNADALQWWAATAGAVRSAVDVEGTQTVTGSKTFSAATTLSGGVTGNLSVSGTIAAGTNGSTLAGTTVTTGDLAVAAGALTVSKTDANGAATITAATGTNAASLAFVNTGGGGQVGVDNATGSTFGSTSAYALTLYAAASRGIELIPGATGANRVSIASTGAVTVRNLLQVAAGGVQVAAGNLAVGAAPLANVGLYATGAILSGATSQAGLQVAATFSSAATAVGYAGYFQVVTAAAAFTLPAGYGVHVADASKGAGSAITDLYGVYVRTQTQAANGHNYNLYVEANAGAADYSLYVAGRAQVVGAANFVATATFAGITSTTGTNAIGGTVNLSGLVQVGAGGSQLGFYGATVASKPTVTGSKGANAALASLLSALATLGLVTDSSS